MALLTQGKEIKNSSLSARDLQEMLAPGADGKRRIKNVVIHDSVIVGDLTLRGIAPIKLSITKTVFTGKATFRSLWFAAGTDFSESTFQKEADFSDAHFQGDAVFQKVTFGGETFFLRTVFEQKATFSDGSFQQPVKFVKTEFRAKTKTLSGYEVQFSHVKFLKAADFTEVSFGTPETDTSVSTQFVGVTFAGEASFSKASFWGDTTFDHATFQQATSFSHAHLTLFTIKNSLFSETTDFYNINGLSVDEEVVSKFWLHGVRFKERAYFDAAKLTLLSLSTRPLGEAPLEQIQNKNLRGRLTPPTVFEKPATFQRIDCEVGDFTETEFRDYADFLGATFRKFLNFDRVTFGGDVTFARVNFPKKTPSDNPRAGLAHEEEKTNAEQEIGDSPAVFNLDGARFEKGLELNWRQLVESRPWWRFWGEPEVSLDTKDSMTWAALEQAFSRSNNTEAQNQATYQRRLLSPLDEQPYKESRFWNSVSREFWGYGVRPWRVARCMLVVYLLFVVFIYYPLTREYKPHTPRNRWRIALLFGLHSARKWGYSFESRSSARVKAISSLQYFLFVLMLVFLVKAFANVSPLINDLLGKLLPG